MIKSAVLLFISFLIHQEINAVYAQKLSVEQSFSYVWDQGDVGFGIIYSEFSASTSFNISVYDNFHLGVRTYIVNAQNRILPIFSNWSHLIGPTLRYSYENLERVSPFIEAGFYWGNYCPNCFPNNAYFANSFNYISGLIGVNIAFLKKTPSLNLSLMYAVNHVLKNSTLNGYNLPLIGIQYRFGGYSNRTI